MESRPVPKIAVLVSGRGSNLRAIVDAIEAGRLRAEVGLVLSNREDADAVAFAGGRGLPVRTLPHQSFASRDDFDRALVGAIQASGAEIVCLAGFMRRLGVRFCDAFRHQILNVHPSLLPAFPGAHAQRQALEHGVRVAGATVHFVTPELDAGPIVLQAAVPVFEDDTVESLSARILVEEHRIYPDAIARVLGGGWRLDGRRVRFSVPAV